jgi:hypothetical protein
MGPAQLVPSDVDREAERQQPEDLIPVLRNANLQRARAGFGSKRRNDRFLELLSAYGKQHWTEHDAFVFT